MIRLPNLIAPPLGPFVKKMTSNRSVVAKSPSFRPRNGATALEYIIVAFLILVIGALISMGVLRAREGARDQLCLSRLLQLARAVEDYSEIQREYPGYSNPDQKAQTAAKSWVASTLPYLEDRLPVLAKTSDGWEINKEAGDVDPKAINRPWEDWRNALKTPLSHLVCPSEDASKLAPGACSYIASCGFPDAPEGSDRADFAANGIFLDLDRLPPLTPALVTSLDGTGFTLLLSENVQSGSWDSTEEADIGFVWAEKLAGSDSSGAPEILAINRESKGKPKGYRTARPSSQHVGGVHVVFANTRLAKIADSIDPVVYIRLCTVDDTGLKNPWNNAPIGPPIGRDTAKDGDSPASP
jgi:hypothetical protein